MTADWLDLRESIDNRFRSVELAEAFAEAAAGVDAIADLACGIGANIQYLNGLLNRRVPWIGIDQDHGALADASERFADQDVQLLQCDLSSQLGQLSLIENAAVTASAFLDIVSCDWLQQFADRFCEIPLLISMTTSGQPEWSPVEEADDSIANVLALHQQGNHGFGPAAGARAASELAELLRRRGCNVTIVDTDWQLNSSDGSMMEMMIGGIGRRVRSLAPSIRIDAWEQTRRNQLAEKTLRLTVKHQDLLSLPERKYNDRPVKIR